VPKEIQPKGGRRERGEAAVDCERGTKRDVIHSKIEELENERRRDGLSRLKKGGKRSFKEKKKRVPFCNDQGPV